MSIVLKPTTLHVQAAKHRVLLHSGVSGASGTVIGAKGFTVQFEFAELSHAFVLLTIFSATFCAAWYIFFVVDSAQTSVD